MRPIEHDKAHRLADALIAKGSTYSVLEKERKIHCFKKALEYLEAAKKDGRIGELSSELTASKIRRLRRMLG